MITLIVFQLFIVTAAGQATSQFALDETEGIRAKLAFLEMHTQHCEADADKRIKENNMEIQALRVQNTQLISDMETLKTDTEESNIGTESLLSDLSTKAEELQNGNMRLASEVAQLTQNVQDNCHSDVPRSCYEVQKQSSASVDTEYCLAVDHRNKTHGARIYCHGMDTNVPKEYLTLPSGEDENLSFTQHNTECSTGTIKYSRVGLNLKTMVINNWDDTFTTKDLTELTAAEDCQQTPMYGKAFACGSFRGVAKLDLRDTGFYIPQSVTWVTSPGSWRPHIESIQRTAQTVTAICYGNCGGCVPTGGPNGGNLLSDVYTEKVMTVAYNMALDTNICKF